MPGDFLSGGGIPFFQRRQFRRVGSGQDVLAPGQVGDAVADGAVMLQLVLLFRPLGAQRGQFRLRQRR